VRDRAPYYAYSESGAIQDVSYASSINLGHLTFAHPGTYFVTYDLRVFSQGPGASGLFCDFANGGNMSQVNTYVPTTVTQLTESGIIQVLSAGATADLLCHTAGSSDPDITASYDMTGIKVTP